MREKRFAPCNLNRATISLGKQGEANHLRIEFDCSGWLAEYPDAIIVLYYFAPERAADNPIRPVLGEEGTDRVWIISEVDTMNAGNGVIELVLEDAETAAVLKSATGYTSVTYSPSAMPLNEDDGGDNEGSGGGTGEDGGYYKPSVSSSGDLSWTPSKAGMPSVNTVNIRGPEGKQGQPGYTPQKGIDYFDGAPGAPGKNGQAATLEIVDADSLPYGSKPNVTEEAGSTPQARKYRLGIPEGKPGANVPGSGGSVELDTTLTQYGQAADAGAVGNALEQEKQARAQALNELKEAIDDKLDASELHTAINTALAQAKESGQFDGAPGAPGEPGKDYVLTEADKEEIAEMAAEKVEVPEGGGGNYTLPIASPSQLGGVKPAAKTDGMTQEIGVDAEGRLWGMPGGSGGRNWELIADITLTEPVRMIEITKDLDGNEFSLSEIVVDASTKQERADGEDFAGNRNLYVEINSGGAGWFNLKFSSGTDFVPFFAHYQAIGGVVFGYAKRTVEKTSASYSAKVEANAVNTQRANAINKVSIDGEYTFASGVQNRFSIGTSAKIYGVRI